MEAPGLRTERKPLSRWSRDSLSGEGVLKSLPNRGHIGDQRARLIPRYQRSVLPITPVGKAFFQDRHARLPGEFHYPSSREGDNGHARKPAANGPDQHAGKEGIALRRVVEAAMQFDAFQPNSRGPGDDGQCGDLVEQEQFQGVRREVDVAASKGIRKPRMGPQPHGMPQCNPDTVIHRVRVSGMTTAGDVRRGDPAHERTGSGSGLPFTQITTEIQGRIRGGGILFFDQEGARTGHIIGRFVAAGPAIGYLWAPGGNSPENHGTRRDSGGPCIDFFPGIASGPGKCEDFPTRMRITLSLVTVLVATLVAGCSRPEAPAELHWSFAGGNALRAQTNAPLLAEALRIPQADAVGAPLASRLADVLWNIGTGGKPPTSANSELGSGVLDDLLRLPSVGEVSIKKSGHEFAVGVQGLGDGAAGWEKNWIAFARAMHAARGGGGEPATLRQEGWLFAVTDASAFPPAATAKRLMADRADAGTLVEFDFRYPGRVTVKAAMTASEGFARWTGTATLAKPLPSRLPAWEIPGAIREPLVMFTAARGLGSLAGSLPWISAWAGKSVPSELFVWGQPGLPEGGHTYFAARMDDPAAAVADIRNRITPLFPPSKQAKFHGQVTYDEKIPRLVVSGNLPVIPMFEAQKEGDRGYLTFGFIPARRTTNALSAEMMGQLNRSNLVYYNWEFTVEAIRHWNIMGQMYSLFEGRHAVQSTPAAQWMQTVAPTLGETVTEVLETSPTTLTLRRKSPLGLSGLEIVALAKWLDPVPPFRRVLPPATNAPAKNLPVKK